VRLDLAVRLQIQKLYTNRLMEVVIECVECISKKFLCIALHNYLFDTP